MSRFELTRSALADLDELWTVSPRTAPKLLTA